jgi:hypothetical protein
MRASPGAKTPPKTKYQTAAVQKFASGMNKETRIHDATADSVMDIKEPVMAFEVASPRRIKMWEFAKAKEAWRAKYSLIHRYPFKESPKVEQRSCAVMFV